MTSTNDTHEYICLSLSLAKVFDKFSIFLIFVFKMMASGVARAISEGDIFLYSCSAQLISFEVD